MTNKLIGNKDLREQLEDWAADCERVEYGAAKMLEMLWPVIAAACALDEEVTRALREAQVTNHQSFVNIKLDCMGVHDALKELREKLSKELT